MQMLTTSEYGSGGTPLVIAHGLFGSGRNWGVIAKRLSDTRRVITLDMRNHGHSFHDDDNSYHALAGDIAACLAGLGSCDVLGHSMGGKAAMVTALAGTPIRRLVVADIAPVAYGHSQQHLIDIMQSLDLGHIETRQDADAALATQIAEPGIRAFLLQSLDVRGKRWRFNLNALSHWMDDIVGWPDVTGQFENPTLFLTGAESEYVTRAHRDTIKSLFPKARFAKLPGAGHWLHADKPREFEAAVRVFLDAPD